MTTLNSKPFDQPFGGLAQIYLEYMWVKEEPKKLGFTSQKVASSSGKRHRQRNTGQSPKQHGPPLGRFSRRPGSAESKNSMESIESKVLRECESMLRKVKKQQNFYRNYSQCPQNERAQRQLKNTISMLEQSVKSKDKALLRMHGMVRQLEADYGSLMKCSLTRLDTQTIGQYGLDMPQKQIRLKQHHHNNDNRSVNTNATIVNSVVTACTNTMVQTQADGAESHSRQLAARYMEECLNKENSMIFEIRAYTARIEELQTELARLTKKGSGSEYFQQLT